MQTRFPFCIASSEQLEAMSYSPLDCQWESHNLDDSIYKPYVSRSPLPYPPHLLPFSWLPTLILPQRLVFMQTCQIRSCPEPLHLVVPLRKMLLPRCSQNLLLHLSQMLSPQWAIPFPSNLKLQLYYPSSPAPHILYLSLCSSTFLHSIFHSYMLCILHMYLFVIFLPCIKSKHDETRDFRLFCLL